MLTKYIPPHVEITVDYFLVYDDGIGNGFWFPCDKEGKLLPDVPDTARKNQIFCFRHPERYTRWNKVIEESRSYRTPPTGVCECGERFELHDTYQGACECPGCGKWYNLFGQELLPPEEWNVEDPNE